MSDLFKNRAAMKARARERDEERLRRGEITPSQLQQENLVFRGFKRGSRRERSAFLRNTCGRSNSGARKKMTD